MRLAQNTSQVNNGGCGSPDVVACTTTASLRPNCTCLEGNARNAYGFCAPSPCASPPNGGCDDAPANVCTVSADFAAVCSCGAGYAKDGDGTCVPICSVNNGSACRS